MPETRKLFHDHLSRRFRAIERTARRKLNQIDRAAALRDLALPGNLSND
jgi:plasmid maintenance system killer protein